MPSQRARTCSKLANRQTCDFQRLFGQLWTNFRLQTVMSIYGSYANVFLVDFEQVRNWQACRLHSLLTYSQMFEVMTPLNKVVDITSVM